MSQLSKRLSLLSQPGHHPDLAQIRRGLEKESLRVTPGGELSLRPHPRSLGSTLTHPLITTDFSEALLEFITPPLTSVPEVIQSLEEVHRFTYANIGDELLWVNSMPCVLGRDEDIPLAEYGSSNIGRMKKIYREGLGHRYGRLMQTIAGIHYNWSLPDVCWQLLAREEGIKDSLQNFKTQQYFALIRNFRRHFWLLLYLFGAAPAVCRSFVANRGHQLTPFNGDAHSLYAPFATSLRMGDLGYQSEAQASLTVCYNDLATYVETLRAALTSPYPPYEKIGVKGADNRYRQLNTHLLQIENEFYSTIRPKRTTESGETPIRALWQRGIEYVEIRCIDLNPYLPVGIDESQMYFMEVFLLHCLLQESPATNNEEYQHLSDNQRRIVYQGRAPGLTLFRNGGEVTLEAWTEELFAELEPVAALLDLNMPTPVHGDAVTLQREKVAGHVPNPATQLLDDMKTSGQTYFQTALRHARQHREYFLDHPLDASLVAYFQSLARESLAKQVEIEQSDDISFEAYLDRFYRQYDLDVEP